MEKLHSTHLVIPRGLVCSHSAISDITTIQHLRFSHGRSTTWFSSIMRVDPSLRRRQHVNLISTYTWYMISLQEKFNCHWSYLVSVESIQEVLIDLKKYILDWEAGGPPLGMGRTLSRWPLCKFLLCQDSLSFELYINSLGLPHEVLPCPFMAN